MLIVILGGGGFIGSAVAERLLADGHAVRIFSRQRTAPWRQFEDAERIEWMTGDVRSEPDLAAVVAGADVVVHLVSTTVPGSSVNDPVHDVQSNLVPAVKLLEIMVGQGIERIIFVSSGGTVYGPPRYLPMDEDHPTRPIVAYGATKLAIERALLQYRHNHGIQVGILRVANAYGPRQRADRGQGAVATFIDQARAGRRLEVWGDGLTIRDYVYVTDVADALARLLRYRGEHAVFNIGSGRGVSVNRLIGIIRKSMNTRLETVYRSARRFDVPENVLDVSLAAQELHWRPRVSLEDGIATTLDWYRSEMVAG